jgi:hypothetical protein
MEQIKFTEEEISQINQLRKDSTDVFIQLGQLSIERKKKLDELDSIEQQLLHKFSGLTQLEEELFKKLNQKYGDGNYDLNTGVFTPLSVDEVNNQQ